MAFSVNVRDRVQAERDLTAYHIDLALVFELIHLVDWEVLYELPQQVHAVFRDDSPLAQKPVLRLRDCLCVAAVVLSASCGVRHLLDIGAARRSLASDPVLETDFFELIRYYVMEEDAVGFQIPIQLNLQRQAGLAHRPIFEVDVPHHRLALGQMRGRPLPVIPVKFASQLEAHLEELIQLQ